MPTVIARTLLLVRFLRELALLLRAQWLQCRSRLLKNIIEVPVAGVISSCGNRLLTFAIYWLCYKDEMRDYRLWVAKANTPPHKCQYAN